MIMVDDVRGPFSRPFFLKVLFSLSLRVRLSLRNKNLALLFLSDKGIRSVTEVKGHKVFYR